MTTARQWNIINNAEFSRIAQDLSTWIQFDANSLAMLLSISEEIKNENYACDSAKNPSAQSSSWWPFSRTQATAKTEAPAKPELEILIDRLKVLDKYDVINRLSVLVEFLERDQSEKRHDSIIFIAKLSKKHPNYNDETDFPEKALSGVKESFINELKRAIGLTRMIPKPPPMPTADILAKLSRPANEKGYFLQAMYMEKPEDKSIRGFTLYFYLVSNKIEYAVKNAEGNVERITLGNELGDSTLGIREVLKDKNQQKQLNADQTQAIFNITSQRGYKPMSKGITTSVGFALGSDAIKKEIERVWQVREEKQEKKLTDEIARLSNIEVADVASRDSFEEEVSRQSRIKL